jgi:hypothetical protein
MEVKLNIKRKLQLEPSVLEEKIYNYLKMNSYRITERGSGYIIFIDDKFSNRRKSRSDFHTRIGEGKFEFNCLDRHETSVQLTYFTSFSYYVFLVMLSSAFGIYTNNIVMPIVFSLVLTIPVLYRIYYLNLHVFEEVMKC